MWLGYICHRADKTNKVNLALRGNQMLFSVSSCYFDRHCLPRERDVPCWKMIILKNVELGDGASIYFFKQVSIFSAGFNKNTDTALMAVSMGFQITLCRYLNSFWG